MTWTVTKFAEIRDGNCEIISLVVLVRPQIHPPHSQLFGFIRSTLESSLS